MNAQVKGWLDFGVRAVIVVVAAYLMMSMFFMADYRRTGQMLSSLEGQVTSMGKQSQLLTSLSISNNTDALYHMALEDESRGNIPSAVQRLSTAIQLAEFNAQQYKIKLSQIIQSQARP